MFFLGQLVKSSDDESRPRCAKRERKRVSDFFERFPRSWQTFGPSMLLTSSSLAVYKRGTLSELRRLWFAYTVTFDEQTRSGSGSRLPPRMA